MRTATRSLCLALAACLALPSHLFAQHVVPEGAIAARLAAAAADRAINRSKLDRVLSTGVTAEVASALGLDPERLRARVAALGDDELRDLAARTDALSTNPVAGGTKKTLIIVGVIVLVVVLLAISIVESCKKQGAECLK